MLVGFVQVWTDFERGLVEIAEKGVFITSTIKKYELS
jgi:hypothetical protein